MRYNKEDVCNMVDTGVLWRALPDSYFGQRGKVEGMEKTIKQRITIVFL